MTESEVKLKDLLRVKEESEKGGLKLKIKKKKKEKKFHLLEIPWTAACVFPVHHQLLELAQTHVH